MPKTCPENRLTPLLDGRQITASALAAFRASLVPAGRLAKAGFTGITVTADCRDDPPGPGSDDRTFHAVRS